MKKRLVFLPALLVLGLSPAAFAAAPGSVLVEGVLHSAGGGPAADGSYDMTFSVYSAQTGGTAAWTEGPAKVAVNGGRFTRRLGAAKGVDGKKLAALGAQWLEIKVGSDPALPRQPMNAVVFALYAKAAGSVQCSGCLTGKNIAGGSVGPAQVNFAYAAAADGIKGGDAKVARALKCTGCVSVKHMKFDAAVNMGSNALVAGKVTSNSDVVAKGTVAAKTFVGDGSKLTGIKTAAGKCAKQGEMVKGINPDGTLICAASELPADGLSQVSNGQLSTQFFDPIQGGKNKDIPDNNPDGLYDVIKFPDIGIAQNIEVNVNINNSDTADLAVFLFPPNAPKLPAERKSIIKNFPVKPAIDPKVYPHYVLHMKTQFNKANKTAIVTTYPTKTKTLTGDIHKDWLNKNIKGEWRLLIIDTAFLNNKVDGKLISWNITVKTLSNKQVNVTGTAYVGGTLWGKYQGSGKPGGAVKVGGGIQFTPQKAQSSCTAAQKGTVRWIEKRGLMACTGTIWVPALNTPAIFQGGATKSNPGGDAWRYRPIEHVTINTAPEIYKLDGNSAKCCSDNSAYGRVYVHAEGYYFVFSNRSGHFRYGRTLIYVNGSNIAENRTHMWTNTENSVNIQRMVYLKKGDYIQMRDHAASGSSYNWRWGTGSKHITYSYYNSFMLMYMGPNKW